MSARFFKWGTRLFTGIAAYGVADSNIQLIKRLLLNNLPSRSRFYGGAICAMIVMSAMTSAIAWIMSEVVNGMVIDRDVTKTMGIAVAVACIFVVKGLAGYVQGVFLSRAGNSIIAEQQRNIFDKIVDGDVAFILDNKSSDLLVRVTHAAQSARNVIDTIIMSFARDLLTLIGLLIVMIIQAPMLSLIGLVFGPLAIWGVRVLLRTVRGIMEQELQSLNVIIRIIQETSAGFRVVKAYSLEDNLRGSMNQAVGNVEQRANAIARLEAATSPLMETLAGIAIAGIIAFSGIMVLQNGQAPGEIMSFITALLLAYDPAKRLARMRVSIESGMVGVRMLFELLDHPMKMREMSGAFEIGDGPGLVEFERVNFSYQHGQPILANLDIRFDPGRVTALVGPSGSGKSTIINLVMRLFDPDSGTVRIDGVDVKEVTFSSLRNKVSYVSQDPFLFAGSIRQNILIGRKNATEDEVIDAAKAASAHDFIIGLENGYETDIGENGNRLSGGQRQRLSIARAFLRNSKILILDEATSALDAKAEAAIKETVTRLARGRTTIVIAHRLSMVNRADHIIVLEHGKIAEQGTPSELMKQNGLYRSLYEHQFETTDAE